MATLASVRNQLLDELARTGQLTAQAHTYINQAVKHYKKKNFWFNEKRVELSTSAGQEYYDLTADFAIMQSLSIAITTLSTTPSSVVNSYPLRVKTFQKMEELYISSENYQGYPQDYTIHNYQLRLQPVPNGSYKLPMAYRRQAEPLSATSASNYLIENAEDLIVARAARLMCTKILQDSKRAVDFKGDELEALQIHESETTEYQMTGYTKRRK